MSDISKIFLNILWQSAAITVIGFILLKVLRNLSAPKRSLLAMSIFIALTILPFLTLFSISNKIQVASYNATPLVKKTFASNQNFIIPNLQSKTLTDISNTKNQRPKRIIAKKSYSMPKFDSEFFNKLLDCSYYLWGAGIIFMLSEIILGLKFLTNFKRNLKLLKNQHSFTIFEKTSVIFKMKQIPKVYKTKQIESPLTLGLFSPILVLPENDLDSLTNDQLASIALHEFSHIYHRDHLFGIFKRIIIACYWWNPILYKISNIHSIAREDVCDNYVLSQLDSVTYSKCLVDLTDRATSLNSYNLPATAGMASSHLNLKVRIKNILSTKRNKQMKNSRSLKYSAAVVVCFFVALIGGIHCTFAENNDKKIKKKLADKEDLDFTSLYLKGIKLSDKDIAKLEEKYAKNKDDIKTAALLLGSYMQKRIRHKEYKIKSNNIVEYLIKNYPESPIFQDPITNICKTGSSDRFLTFWEEQIQIKPKNTTILSNAASNLTLYDTDIAIKYMTQCAKLEPNNPKWDETLGHLYALPSIEKMDKAFKHYQNAYKKSDSKKKINILQYLAPIAISLDKFQLATKYATDLLEASKISSKKYPYFPLGNQIYTGNSVLGQVAFKQGKIAEAKKYLLKSIETPGSPTLMSGGIDFTLADMLLKHGEKECVIEFLTKYSQINTHRPDTVKLLIKQIQEGKRNHLDGLSMLMPKDLKEHSKQRSQENKKTTKTTNENQSLAIKYRKEEIKYRKIRAKGLDLTQGEINKLEAKLANNPSDTETATLLIVRYPNHGVSKKYDAKVNKIIEFFIKNDPENFFLIQSFASLRSSKEDSKFVKLWNEQVQKNPNNTLILKIAASNIKYIAPQESIKFYKMIKKIEGSIAWDFHIARILYKMKKYDEAIKYYQEMYNNNEQKYKASISRTIANCALEGNKLAIAEEYAKKTLDLLDKETTKQKYFYNFYPEINEVLGQIAFKRGNVEEAKKYLLLSLDIPEKYPIETTTGFNFDLANILLLHGEKECVIKYLKKYAKLFPKFSQQALIDIKKIEAGQDTKLYSFTNASETKRDLEHEAIQKKHSLFQKLVSKGTNLKNDEITKLSKKYAKNQDDLKTAALLVGYYKYNKNNAELYNIASFLIKKYPDSPILVNFSFDSQQTEIFNKIAKLWADQAKKNPKNRDILSNARRNLGNSNKSVEYIKMLMNLEPYNGWWDQDLASLYLARGEKKKALSSLITAYDKSIYENKTHILIDIAEVAFSLKKYDIAEKYANDLIAESKKDRSTSRFFAYGTLIYHCNSILGQVAFYRDSSLSKAKKYLLKSSDFPHQNIKTGYTNDLTLANILLENGEKECVIKFLTNYAKNINFMPENVKILIKQIKDGKRNYLDTGSIPHPNLIINKNRKKG
ncbi:M56 family metallopeptidase [Lentisphaerota bacterium WC36G]|nr:hypothetical protein LJT99_04380 [Lentisphaerae bacterium WC36]